MRKVLTIAALSVTVLAGCEPTVPDSGAPVGFDRVDLDRERALRDARLEGVELQPAPVVTDSILPPVSATPSAANQGATGDSTVIAVDQGAIPTGPAPEAVTDSGISAENDFTRVGELRTIETDAERLRRNREQYVVIQPQDLPQRSGSAGPNIVAYALKTTNPKGVSLYRRVGLNAQNKFLRNCRKYASPDLAQQDFLSNGGPEKDRLGLDPDGDGFACAWDPAPFRLASRG